MRSFDGMPPGYRQAVEGQLVGFGPFTALQPWYFLKPEDVLDIPKIWPSGPCNIPLAGFARRQDDDTIACFDMSTEPADAVVVIDGWIGGSYVVLQRFASFSDWMEDARNDHLEWVAQSA